MSGTAFEANAHGPAAAKLVLEELTADTPPDAVNAARELLLSYGHFVASQPHVASFRFAALEQEAANLPYSYLNQNGGSLIARLQPSPTGHEAPIDPRVPIDSQVPIDPQAWIGFVAWRSLPSVELSDAWEIKRLWIHPGSRAAGLGRAMVEAVIARARSAGKSRIFLDTAPEAMPAAYRLYQKMNFVACPAYSGPPADGIVYMCKQL